jgi:hypothetical protein
MTAQWQMRRPGWRTAACALVLAGVALVSSSCGDAQPASTPVAVAAAPTTTGAVHQHGISCAIQPYTGFSATTAKGTAVNTGRSPLTVIELVSFENPQGALVNVVHAGFTLAPGASEPWQGYTAILHSVHGGRLVRVTQCVVHTTIHPAQSS